MRKVFRKMLLLFIFSLLWLISGCVSGADSLSSKSEKTQEDEKPVMELGKGDLTSTASISAHIFDDKEIATLLSDGRNCNKDVCFLGIIPGKTDIVNALKFFSDLNIPIYSEDNYYEISISNSDRSYIYVVLVSENGVVKSIKIHFQQSDQNELFSGYPGNYSRFPSRYAAYSFKSDFLQYGMPDDIRVSVSFPTEFDKKNKDSILYSLYVYYAKNKTIFEYDFGTTKNENSILLCPAEDSFLGLTIWLGDNPEYPPLQESQLAKFTDSSLNEFYENFMTKDNPKCLDVDYEKYIDK